MAVIGLHVFMTASNGACHCPLPPPRHGLLHGLLRSLLRGLNCRDLCHACCMTRSFLAAWLQLDMEVNVQLIRLFTSLFYPVWLPYPSSSLPPSCAICFCPPPLPPPQTALWSVWPRMRRPIIIRHINGIIYTFSSNSILWRPTKNADYLIRLIILVG